MEETIRLKKQEARRFLLTHQCLLPPRSLQGKTGILEYLRRVRCVQFDPIDVTGRNHEIALQARVKDFSTEMLYDALYNDRALVDGFDKNMCVYCADDWPYFRRDRDANRRSLEIKSHPVIEAAAGVRKEIEERGPLSSADLEMEEAVRWPWGPTRLARAALEGMYFWGELVIHHKVGVRKVYDLAERHLPDVLVSAPEPNSKEEDYHDWHVHRRIGSVGLLANRGTEAWLGILGTSAVKRTKSLERLKAQSRIRAVEIEDLDVPAYIRAEDEPILNAAVGPVKPDMAAAVIAPLDNLIWDRRLIKDLFGFEYTWEVYTPPEKRRYGYYVMPVLYGDRFVARVQPVRDRKTKTLVLKGWWWEDGVNPGDSDMRSALAQCFDQFREFLGCDSITIEGQCASFLSWMVV